MNNLLNEETLREDLKKKNWNEEKIRAAGADGFFIIQVSSLSS